MDAQRRAKHIWARYEDKIVVWLIRFESSLISVFRCALMSDMNRTSYFIILCVLDALSQCHYKTMSKEEKQREQKGYVTTL